MTAQTILVRWVSAEPCHVLQKADTSAMSVLKIARETELP